MQWVRTETQFFSVFFFQWCCMMKDSAGDSAESNRGLYWYNDYKRCGTLCFDLLATVQCNCTHIWKVHIGHSPLSIFLQLNGWLCLAVKKWALLPALASCLIVPNLYFIKMMTHCTRSPLLTPVLLISNSLGLVANNKLPQASAALFFKHSPSIIDVMKHRNYTMTWGTFRSPCHESLSLKMCWEQFHPHDWHAQQMYSTTEDCPHMIHCMFSNSRSENRRIHLTWLLIVPQYFVDNSKEHHNQLYFLYFLQTHSFSHVPGAITGRIPAS